MFFRTFSVSISASTFIYFWISFFIILGAQKWWKSGIFVIIFLVVFRTSFFIDFNQTWSHNGTKSERGMLPFWPQKSTLAPKTLQTSIYIDFWSIFIDFSLILTYFSVILHLLGSISAQKSCLPVPFPQNICKKTQIFLACMPTSLGPGAVPCQRQLRCID